MAFINIKNWIKQTYFYHMWNMFRLRKSRDPEMAMLPVLCDRASASIDVGAANGVYTTQLIRYSKYCYAFEPVPERAARLANALRGRVTVFQQALSSEKGTAILTIPLVGSDRVFGRASIEPGNSMQEFPTTSIDVSVSRLDDLKFPKIGFIKIDVEGHELDVLKGAMVLIRRDTPSLLVEAEERHKAGAINGIRALLEPVGYKGFFLMDDKLLPISEFDMSLYQSIDNAPAPGIKKSGTYINNFIFVAAPDVISKLQQIN